MQGQPYREVSGGEAGGRQLTIYTPDSYKAPVIGSIVNCAPGTWEQHSRHLGTAFPTPGNSIPNAWEQHSHMTGHSPDRMAGLRQSPVPGIQANAYN